MAKVTNLADDFTGEIGASVQERRIKLGRVTYVADMSDETYERLVSTPLAEFLSGEAVRKVVPADHSGEADENGTTEETSRDEDAAIRRFGKAHDLVKSDKGRLAASVRKAWHEATPETQNEYREAVKAS